MAKKKEVAFNVSAIAKIERKNEYKSELNHLETVNVLLENEKSTPQTENVPQMERKYKTSTTITKSHESSHEIGVDVEPIAGFDFYAKVEMELSADHLYHAGTSETTETSKTTTFEKRINVPSQDVVLEPHSKVEVSTEFFAQQVIVHYSVDLYVNSVSIMYPEIDESYLASISCVLDKFESEKYTTVNLSPFVNLPGFEKDDIQIGQKDGKFILKNIPVVVEKTEYLTKVSFAKEK